MNVNTNIQMFRVSGISDHKRIFRYFRFRLSSHDSKLTLKLASVHFQQFAHKMGHLKIWNLWWKLEPEMWTLWRRWEVICWTSSGWEGDCTECRVIPSGPAHPVPRKSLAANGQEPSFFKSSVPINDATFNIGSWHTQSSFLTALLLLLLAAKVYCF